jgi:hypothetical protein
MYVLPHTALRYVRSVKASIGEQIAEVKHVAGKIWDVQVREGGREGGGAVTACWWKPGAAPSWGL